MIPKRSSKTPRIALPRNRAKENGLQDLGARFVLLCLTNLFCIYKLYFTHITCPFSDVVNRFITIDNTSLNISIVTFVS